MFDAHTNRRYTIDTVTGQRQTRVKVNGPDGREFTATAYHATIDGFYPERAKVGWPSIGPVEAELAEAVAAAIERASQIAVRSNKQPIGMAPKYGRGPSEKLRVDTDEARELAKLHKAHGALFWAYSSSAEWDWDLGEPVYSLGLGARVLYRVPESAITPVTDRRLEA